MTDRLFSLSEMARVICYRDGRKTDEAQVWQRLRGLHQRGLLSSSDNRGDRGAARFQPVQFARAAALLELLDIGIEADDLRRVDNGMRIEEIKAFANGSHVRTGLAAAVDQLSNPNGQDYFLLVNILRRNSDGVRYLSGNIAPKHLLRFKPEEIFDQSLYVTFLDDDFNRYPVKLHSTIVIPLTALLRPLLTRLQTHSEPERQGSCECHA